MKRTVWHLCSNRWNSAITEYALRSAQALSRQGWHSELSALPSSPGERRARDLGLAGPSFRFGLGDLWAIRHRARELKPDFIICYGGPETFLARFLGVPVIRFRGQDRDLAEPLSALEVRLNLGFCRGVLVPAKVLETRFQRLLPKGRVQAVALGLDTAVFHHPPNQSRSERPRLLIVGRLDPIKGHRPFLEVFARLSQQWDQPVPKPFLEIIGQNSNLTAEDLRTTAQNLGLVEGVDWQIDGSRVSDLPRRMAGATLGLVPSLGSEVIGRVTEEFLLCGTPVALSGVGSLEECLREESFGLSLRAQSGEALLKDWIVRGFQETEDQRIKRSLQAAGYFGLESMGRSLAGFLEDLG